MSRNQQLTKAQVDALMECFDFVRNGYDLLAEVDDGSTKVVRLKHNRFKRTIEVLMSDWWYIITKNGRQVKAVRYKPNHVRYSIIVNSDTTVTYARNDYYASQKLVSG